MAAANPVDPSIPARRSRVATLIVAGLVAVMALRVSFAAWDYAVTSPRLPHWDAASRALLAAQMADALRHLDFGRYASMVWESSPWPPLFHMLEAPVLLAFGDHYHVAAAPMPFLYFGVILAAFALGVAMGGPGGVLVGAIGAAFMASSTMFQVFGGLIMLEIPGTLLLLLGLTFAVRYRRFGAVRDAWLLGACAALLFFLKYNYFVFLLVPVALNEMGHDLPAPRALAARAVTAARSFRWTPFRVLLALGIVAVAALALLRHSTVSLLGRTIQVPGVRSAALVLAAIAALGFLVRMRANARAVAAWFGNLTPGVRAVLWIGVLPCALWLASPVHLKSFFVVIANRSSHYPLLSPENLLYYPRSILFDYSPTPAIGVLALVLAAASLLLAPRMVPERRLLPIAFAVGFVLTTAHRFKADRFFFLVAALLWMCAALAVVELIERAARAAEARRRGMLEIAAGALAVVCAIAFGFRARKADDYFVRSSTPEQVNHVLDDICRVNLASRGTVLIGTWNELSTGLVEWYQHHYLGQVPGPTRPKNPLWYVDLSPGGLLRRIAQDTDVDRVIVLSLPEKAAAYHRTFDLENAWVPPVAAAIAHTSRFKLESARVFEDTGYRMSVYRKVEPGEASAAATETRNPS